MRRRRRSIPWGLPGRSAPSRSWLVRAGNGCRCAMIDGRGCQKEIPMSDQPDRRTFFKVLAAGSAVFARPAWLLGKEEKPTPKTYIFKKVGDCAIKADVYRPVTDEACPAVIWIHGGALIMGDRHGVDSTLRDTALKAGYAFISIDYRLAPETKAPAIHEDVRDACRWVREKGPDLCHINPEKIAVAGRSAAGH